MLTFDDFVTSPEKIDSFVNNYGWFGKMGLTYNFFGNNLEILIMLFFSLLKFCLLKLLLNRFKCLQTIFGKGSNFPKYFLIDFITATPVMTISAL